MNRMLEREAAVMAAKRRVAKSVRVLRGRRVNLAAHESSADPD